VSPTALATLRRIERDTRRLAQGSQWAPMPLTDYWRPAELVRQWRGVGRFFYSPGQLLTPSVNVVR
jgi:hypothetical protein